MRTPDIIYPIGPKEALKLLKDFVLFVAKEGDLITCYELIESLEKTYSAVSDVESLFYDCYEAVCSEHYWDRKKNAFSLSFLIERDDSIDPDDKDYQILGGIQFEVRLKISGYEKTNRNPRLKDLANILESSWDKISLIGNE